MITGFNTDVEFEGVIYHVQTEDKGVETPLILSLVYNRGTILASKRSPYEDLLKDELNEKVLAERLHKQHKLICAAIRGGRLEDLKRMTMKDSEARKAESIASKPIIESKKGGPVSETAEPVKVQAAQNKPIGIETAPVEIKGPPVDVKNLQLPAIRKSIAEPTKIAAEPQNIIEKPIEKSSEKPISVPDRFVTAPLIPAMRTSDRIGQKLAEKIDHAKSEVLSPPVTNKNSPDDDFLKQSLSGNLPASVPKHQLPTVWQPSPQTVEAEEIFEAFEIIDEEMILPAEAVAVVEAFPSAAVLNSKNLEIGFLNETEFKGGDRKTISIIVWRGHRENGIGHAQVMVKVLGSSFRPMIFHSKTDTNGVATVHLQLPHFRSGRAAILVRALANGEEIEMRRVITHG